MIRTEPVALVTSLTFVLAGAALLLPPPGAQALPRVGQAAHRGDGGPNTYFSTPPDPLAGRTRAPKADRRPKPPPTRGSVTGQVTGPNGSSIPNARVTGIRFSDLGLPVDVTEEKQELARTNGSGRDHAEAAPGAVPDPGLLRVGVRAAAASGAALRRVRPGEQQAVHTVLPRPGRQPQQLDAAHPLLPPAALPHRALGRIVVQPPAVVTGTWKDGANRLLNLTRIDGSIAAQMVTDGKGGYRFEVAPGPYRVEADRDEGLHTDSTVPGYVSKRLLLRAGRTGTSPSRPGTPASSAAW